MFKKVLMMSTFLALFATTIIAPSPIAFAFADQTKSVSVAAEEDFTKEAQPYKVDKVQASNGQTANVFYFENEEDAEKFQAEKYSESTVFQEQQFTKEKKSISPALYGYSYLGYHGNIQHFFKEKKVKNNSNSTLKDVKFDFNEQRSTRTSSSVSAEFPKVFKAELGFEYATSHTYSVSIPVDIPAKHYGQVITHNNTDVYKFKHTVYGNFNVYYPTESDEYNVYIVKL
ncbi:hypothetical protein O0555_18785 [Brevibacillus laterosporus]|uniref:hypothetical protein n=1 Tax=Brevibacillus laterosporus TaxID=1465 RepID=UPI0018CEA81D|nr:hypothetical protein [Brevibacillus laterosporus]MBG9797692.1 hypothetical protein [Brevibacillus laterosporus]MCR8939365.1 hypothetical protein [Brevibacillus laterosporus]MCZ0842005.1 hypothetical protein [Brevibacillus laterosporus]MCZ0847723.1 hypothetical protein [Brevibacillus laterosporus]MED1909636.1 hypothetical protein [Brevibacillus laterosporus]